MNNYFRVSIVFLFNNILSDYWNQQTSIYTSIINTKLAGSTWKKI